MSKDKKPVLYRLVDGDLKKVNIGVHILDNSCFSAELHTHTFFDFDFLQAGSLIQIGNSKSIRMNKNEVCIVRPECEHQTLADECNKGDNIIFDLSTGIVKNTTTGKEYICSKFPTEIQNLVNAGGLINYTKEKLNK